MQAWVGRTIAVNTTTFNMNNGYTQTNKKANMAAKMVTKYATTGPGKTGGPGMKFRGHGKQGSADKMKPKMTGKGEGSLAQKPELSNTKHNFIGKRFYDQHGE